MISCPSCGFENVDGIKFCGECGQRLTDSADAAASAAASPPDDLTFDGAPTIAPGAAGVRDGPAPSSASPTAPPGERYRILEKIGQGGMGSVWKAEDTQFSPPRLVAIKRLLESDAENRLAVSRFLQEAGAVAQLNHLHIVTVFDVGEDADGRYIVMQHVDGTPLDQLIAEKGKLSSEETLGIARGIASALSYAHKKRVIHRDIKPANVLVARDGTAKVLDFGLARIGGGSEVSVTGYGMGTTDYAPPEQKRDAKSVDHRADIYALGATMYQMLTGESPKTIRSDRLPAGFEQVVLRCLEERPEDRYFSVDELGADLERVASGEAGAARRKVVIEEEPEGTCASCGAPNSVEARFCRKCGAGLFESCIRCEKEVRAGSEHCIHCGLNLPRAKEADDHLKQARSHAEQHRYGRAIKELERVLELESSHDEARRLLEEARNKRQILTEAKARGEGLAADGQYLEAEEAFREYLETAPGDEEVTGLLATALLSLGGERLLRGLLDEAIEVLERARAVRPDDPRAAQVLAECAARRKRAEELLVRARSHVETRRYTEAIEDLDRIRALDAAHAEEPSLREEAVAAKEHLEKLEAEGRERLEKRDFQGAENVLSQLRDLEPEDEDVARLLLQARISLGDQRLSQGAIVEATRSYRRAQELGLDAKLLEERLEKCHWARRRRRRRRVQMSLAVLLLVFGSVLVAYLLRPAAFTPLGRNSQGYEEYRHDRTGIVFVKLPGGTFRMGSPSSESSRDSDEGPVHDVTLSPFLIAKHEVTQAQWRKVMETSPSHFKGDDLPVEQVSWEECQEFCSKAGLRLPTEAQWEYACRAGTSGPYAGPGRLDDMGWYSSNSGSKTHSVGGKQPNGFGLHDMHGNVWEWCEDVYDPAFYETTAARRKDPVCTTGSEFRVFRGGSWRRNTSDCRSAIRYRISPGRYSSALGIRPSSTLPE